LKCTLNGFRVRCGRLPRVHSNIQLRKAILSLSRWRERVGVRVGTNHIPLTFVLSPWGRGDEKECTFIF